MTKKQQYVSLAFGALVLGLAFQNMTLVEFSTLSMAEVDESSRKEQARELLGEYYRGSFAQKLEGHQNLNYYIYKKVEQSLAPQWKPYTAQLVRTIISESQKYQFDPVFILAVIQTESSFNPMAKGTSGEIGLMQILPPTAKWIAQRYKKPWSGDRSLYDPITNVKLGLIYFAHLREEFDGTAYHYLPAYNMGPKNVRRIERKVGSVDANGKVHRREYAMRVMKNYTTIYEQMAASTRLFNKQKQPGKLSASSETEPSKRR